MKATKEQMKQEAIERMAKAAFRLTDISAFGKEDKPFSNGTYNKDIIRKIERENDLLIYAVFHDESNMGETHSCLFVTSEMENWESERQLLESRTPIAYVNNETVPEYSEFGAIGIDYTEHGIVRKW